MNAFWWQLSVWRNCIVPCRRRAPISGHWTLSLLVVLEPSCVAKCIPDLTTKREAGTFRERKWRCAQALQMNSAYIPWGKVASPKKQMQSIHPIDMCPLKHNYFIFNDSWSRRIFTLPRLLLPKRCQIYLALPSVLVIMWNSLVFKILISLLCLFCGF